MIPLYRGKSGVGGRGTRANLPHDQHFADVVARQEEFDGGKVPEKILDMPVVEHSLQARRFCFVGGMSRQCELDLVHLQRVGSSDVIAIAG